MQLRKKILVVDDDIVGINIIETLLDKDYELKRARSGKQALELAADFLPDVILLNSMLPDVDGGQVCRWVRKDSRLRYSKVIMMSGKSTASERVEAYRAGADDYITKPLDKDELLAKIRVYLRLKFAEEVDQFKTNVLTLLGHEARTPLNSLIASAEMLMSEKDIDTEEQQMFIELVYGAAKRLHCFFEKVMILSTLKSGMLQFNMSVANLCDVAREVIDKVTEKALERGIKIENESEESSIVIADKQEIEKVITALMDNAIRFSPSEGSIKVRVFTESDDVCLSVADEGQGINPDYLPYIFDELSDLDVAHHSMGHGLSLAIARQVVMQHGGTISAESSEGRGTTFTIRLPAAVQPELAHFEK